MWSESQLLAGAPLQHIGSVNVSDFFLLAMSTVSKLVESDKYGVDQEYIYRHPPNQVLGEEWEKVKFSFWRCGVMF